MRFERVRLPWDDETCNHVKERLLRGDRVQDIASDEGLTLNQLSSKFCYEVGQYPRTWALSNKPELRKVRHFRSVSSLSVNEHYFDDFHEKPREDKAYLLGIFYGRPVTSCKDQFCFSSKDETLMDIVRSELEAEQNFKKQAIECSLLRIRAVPHLYQTLCSLGVEGSVRERSFPEISESVLSDFIRGIVEANSGNSGYHSYPRIQFGRFGLSFLVAMNDILTQYAGVSRDNPTSYRFFYKGGNVRQIAGFIYRNKEFLEDTGLFVPEIREKLEGN